jgi:hypothetical protein
LHSAGGWDNVLKAVVSRYPGKVSRVYFRADAGFANPEKCTTIWGLAGGCAAIKSK